MSVGDVHVHSIPPMTPAYEPEPERPRTLTPTRVASFAMPKFLAPTVPATWVPCLTERNEHTGRVSAMVKGSSVAAALYRSHHISSTSYTAAEYPTWHNGITERRRNCRVSLTRSGRRPWTRPTRTTRHRWHGPQTRCARGNCTLKKTRVRAAVYHE